MRQTILPYNPRLKLLARKLRNESTLTEVLLWRELKMKKVLGFDFHRQKPIDEYIVDFYCPQLSLAIEIDGSTHNNEETYKNDEERQKRLRMLGVQMLRFRDEDVKKDLEGVLMRIEDFIKNTPRPNHIGTPLSRGDH